MGDYREKTYLSDNYNKLKFEYQLSVEFLKNDTELIEFLLRKLSDCRDAEELQYEIDDLKGQLAEKEDLEEECRKADITIALLEGDVIDLKNEVFDLYMEISDLRDEINNKNL